jgi:hypothetical protein
MVRGLFVITRFVMFGGFAMVLGRVFMVIRGLLMMLVNFMSSHLLVSRARLIAKRQTWQRSMNYLRRAAV